MHAIIMAGGSGTRFWPASRKHRPKQLLPLARGKTLIGATVDRAARVCGIERCWIITNPLQAEAIAAAVPQLPAGHILVEPEARDTAPCVALATAKVDAVDPGAPLVFMPADHVIDDDDAFAALLRRGAELAADGSRLVTFGIRPTRPATGYGYIERGTAVDDATPPAFDAVRFREKPDLATAEQFLATGTFSWNSGIFVFTRSALLDAMRVGDPELAQQTEAMCAAAAQADEAALAAAFRAAPKTSVDYAVMEKAPRVVVLDADLPWHDLGSFLTLDAVSPTDADGTTEFLHGGARAMSLESKDCVVYAEGQRTVALFGASDLVVVAVDDAVLVCPRDRADELKKLIQAMPDKGFEDLL